MTGFKRLDLTQRSIEVIVFAAFMAVMLGEANPAAGVSLHDFPSAQNRNLRSQWIHQFKMGKVPKNATACSNHFSENDYLPLSEGPGRKCRRLKKEAVPTLNLPECPSKRNPKVEEVNRRRERLERLEKRRLVLESQWTDNNKESDHPEEQILLSAVDSDAQILPGAEDKSCQAVVHVKDEFCQAIIEVDDEACQTAFEVIIDAEGTKFTLLDILCTDKAMNSCAGLLSVSQFQSLCKSVDYVIKETEQVGRFKLDLPSRLLLTLMKLKLNLTFRCLSCFFRITERAASECFFYMIDILDSILKQFIIWFPKEKIRENIPRYFVMFSDTRVVLDCSEIPVQRSKCLNCSIRTYSHYKGRHTLKFLLVVAPDGTITFKSSLYGGRASDKFIVNDSGVLDLCEPHDAVMVDKGFDIQDECTNRNLKLYIPPFFNSLNKQFTAEEVERCRSIARARVHVERTIQRIKIFTIFHGQLPWSLIDYGDKMLTVVCALVNLSPPILSNKQFL